jgi:hypothetical protein
MAIEVRLEEVAAADLAPVDYRWDADTDILAASLRAKSVGEGLTGSLDIQGADGAWLMLEMKAGRLAAVEVAIWPDVATKPGLSAPEPAGTARLCVPSRTAFDGEQALEVDMSIRAVADEPERTIHFRIGPPRPSRAMLVAKDLMVEVDARSQLAGLWLLNVPPFPQSS